MKVKKTYTNCFFFQGWGGESHKKRSPESRQDFIHQGFYGSFDLKLSPHSRKFKSSSSLRFWGIRFWWCPPKKNQGLAHHNASNASLKWDIQYSLLIPSDIQVQISNRKRKTLSNNSIPDQCPTRCWPSLAEAVNLTTSLGKGRLALGKRPFENCWRCWSSTQKSLSLSLSLSLSWWWWWWWWWRWWYSHSNRSTVINGAGNLYIHVPWIDKDLRELERLNQNCDWGIYHINCCRIFMHPQWKANLDT